VSLTIGEASDVNVVTNWLLGRPRNGSDSAPVNPAEARESLAHLATKAHKTLMAGVAADDIPDQDHLGLTVLASLFLTLAPTEVLEALTNLGEDLGLRSTVVVDSDDLVLVSWLLELVSRAPVTS
jgi:hypothetical protein